MRPTRLSVLVLVLGLVITTALTLVGLTVNNWNENRLLSVQVREAATILAAAVPTIQIPLASSVGIAEATNGDPATFASFMAPSAGPVTRSSPRRFGC